MSSAPREDTEEQNTSIVGEGHDTTIFGCGFNGFCQLSCAQGHVDVDMEQLDDSACEEKLLPECLFFMSRKDVAQVQTCWTTVIVLSDEGQVQAYGWIPGEVGQPGYKDDLLHVPGCKIRDIQCVWNKIFLLTRDGKALIWNNVTQQGSVPIPFPSIPSMEESQNAAIRFKIISCSEKHCLAVTEYDKIWLAEVKEVRESLDTEPSELVSRPLLLDKKVQSVSCGKEHSLILTAEGKVYSFGNGSRGQLGHGATDVEHQPRLVEALDGIRLTLAHAGGWHSAVISEFGDLYTWGWNESGQVGVLGESWGESSDDTQRTNGRVQFQMVPALIDFPGENHVIHASCGSRHTGAVTSLAGPDQSVLKRNVVTIGTGAGQTGLVFRLKPRSVPPFRPARAREFDDGRLWTWGWGFYGQLGHGTKEDCFTPTRVKFFIENKLKVRSVTCGAWNTLMTVTSLGE